MRDYVCIILESLINYSIMAQIRITSVIHNNMTTVSLFAEKFVNQYI